MSWVTIRSGVKTRLDTITGVASHSRASLKRTDSVEATVVPLDPLLLQAGHRNKYEVRFAVRVTVTKGSLEDSQTALDAYLWPTGTDSIPAALYGDSTLAGAMDDLQLVEVVGYEQIAESGACRADLNFRGYVSA